MPNILEGHAGKVVKMLFIGDSGTGKTGALYSLAEAGYNLRLLDVDNGADVLVELARKAIADRKPGAIETVQRITYETITEKLKSLNGVAVAEGAPKQFARALDMMTHWKVPDKRGPSPGLGPDKKPIPGEIITPGYDLGPIGTWGERDILIIDSLSRLSEAAIRHVLAMNGRPAGPRQQSDWGTAMEMIEGVLALLYSREVPCHVIVNAHITYVTNEDSNATKAYPNSLGQKLPPKIPSYFNTMVLAASKPVGTKHVRTIFTQPRGMMELKCPAMDRVPAELPIETGLATLFAAIRGESPSSKTPVTKPIPAAAG